MATSSPPLPRCAQMEAGRKEAIYTGAVYRSLLSALPCSLPSSFRPFLPPRVAGRQLPAENKGASCDEDDGLTFFSRPQHGVSRPMLTGGAACRIMALITLMGEKR